MFTGLVERIGAVRRISRGSGLVVEFSFEPWDTPLEKGESVAVNGVCLTVADCDRTRFTADVLAETAEKGGVGGWTPGMKVNMERAMKAGARFGGHVVQGHVDGRGMVVRRTPSGRDFTLRIKCPRTIAAASVVKGSIAIDGVSLTVSALGDDWLEVCIIPTTASCTTLGERRVGDFVNLESDVLGRYAIKRGAEERGDGGQEDQEAPQGGLTMEMLAENGFL